MATRICALLVGAAGVVACATPRATTWETAAPSLTPSTPPPTSTTTAATTSPAQTASTSAGVLIDRALVDLNAARARATRLGRASPLWSQAWLTALQEIDDAVTRAPLASDLGAFVRARVTLEVELQRDAERDVVLPARLAEQVQHTLAAVDESVQELRAANAPGTTLTMMPRLDDGDLVLRAPLSPMVVSSPFGKRRDPFTAHVRYHAGADLDAASGAAVYASASGIVVYAGPQGGYGKYIVLDHGGGIRTHYAHLSAIRVDVGGLVVEGDVIGAVGSTGRSTGPHLHFAVTNELGVFLDPLAVLDIPFGVIGDQVAQKPSTSTPQTTASAQEAAPAPQK